MGMMFFKFAISAKPPMGVKVSATPVNGLALSESEGAPVKVYVTRAAENGSLPVAVARA